jgi:hypothetical protein
MKPLPLVAIVILFLAAAAHADERQVSVTAGDGFALQGNYYSAEKGGPGFVYRLRPEAYGQDIRTFFHQIPVQDMTRGHVNDLQTMLGIGERVFGINDQILGALSGNGRKTATEVRTSTGFGVNRLKTMTEYMSATGFSQHATRMVQMSQQYFTQERKFRIVGSLLSDMNPKAAEAFMNVDPAAIPLVDDGEEHLVSVLLGSESTLLRAATAGSRRSSR